MSELSEKLKSIDFSKKNILLAVVGVFSLVFLLLSGFGNDENKDEKAPSEINSEYALEYSERAEKELEKLLCEISGAGKVKVMVTVDSCYENVFAKGYKSDVQENENQTKSETEEEYIIIKKGSNNEESLIVKVYEPQIKGVAVVAQGADDVFVKQAITETVCALFDISSAKVSVSKMN